MPPESCLQSQPKQGLLTVADPGLRSAVLAKSMVGARGSCLRREQAANSLTEGPSSTSQHKRGAGLFSCCWCGLSTAMPRAAAIDAYRHLSRGHTNRNPDLPKATGTAPQVNPWALPSCTQPLSQVPRLSSSLPISPPFQAHSVPATNSLHTHLRVSWA